MLVLELVMASNSGSSGLSIPTSVSAGISEVIIQQQQLQQQLMLRQLQAQQQQAQQLQIANMNSVTNSNRVQGQVRHSGGQQQQAQLHTSHQNQTQISGASQPAQQHQQGFNVPSVAVNNTAAAAAALSATSASVPQYRLSSSTPQNKYGQLLAVIDDLGRDIRPSYAGSRSAQERLKKGIVLARSIVRECIIEAEMNAKNN
ncbi:uncharacterized protein LOC134841948 [Symsagittifera roscoffensis]|uniref:uncharacterized protein LOC134841948 n=1 Tax=Symsagittifera roscoffensis TaxID=84072 RepID=UPI00307C030E